MKPGKDGGEEGTDRMEMTVEDAKELTRGIATCYKLVTALQSWVMNLADVTMKTINAHKV